MRISWNPSLATSRLNEILVKTSWSLVKRGPGKSLDRAVSKQDLCDKMGNVRISGDALWAFILLLRWILKAQFSATVMRYFQLAFTIPVKQSISELFRVDSAYWLLVSFTMIYDRMMNNDRKASRHPGSSLMRQLVVIFYAYLMIGWEVCGQDSNNKILQIVKWQGMSVGKLMLSITVFV